MKIKLNYGRYLLELPDEHGLFLTHPDLKALRDSFRLLENHSNITMETVRQKYPDMSDEEIAQAIPGEIARFEALQKNFPGNWPIYQNLFTELATLRQEIDSGSQRQTEITQQHTKASATLEEKRGTRAAIHNKHGQTLRTLCERYGVDPALSPAKQATMLRERIEEVERLAPTTTTPTQTQQKGLQPGIRIHNPQNLDLDTFTKELQIQNGFSPSVSRTAITYAKPVLEKIGFRKKVKIAFSSLWRGEGFQWPDSTVVAGMDIRTEKIEDIMKDPTTAFADALATIEERAKLVDEKLPKNKGALQKQFKQLLKTNPDAALKYILALKAATSQQDIAALMQDLKEKSLAPSPRFPGVKVDNKRMEHYNAPKIGQKIERSWFGMRVKSIQYTTQIEEPSPLASADQKQDTSFLHRQGMDPSTHPTRHQSRARSRTRDPQAIEQDDGHDH